MENGLLYIKWAEFWADRKEPQVVDCMPVPLSAELLSRLETEEFDDLVQLSLIHICLLPGDYPRADRSRHQGQD